VLKQGERLQTSVIDAAEQMGPGDVFIKGANALNYERGQAAVLIGHATGGTVGATLGRIVARRIQLVSPVGLEKSVPVDLAATAQRVNLADDEKNYVPCFWPLIGHIFTEIEALEVLCGVQTTLIAAGGVAGAEGSVRLLLEGMDEDVEAATELVKSIKGVTARQTNRLRGRNGGSIWQKDYYDRSVRDEADFQVKLNYMARNPVKRGLVTKTQEWDAIDLPGWTPSLENNRL
jgi:hypothetical protein